MTLSRNRAAELLHDTADLICGERAKAYGEPEDSFNDIASYWSRYLGVTITSFDVGIMMILMKVSRGGRDRFKRDNLVDIAGYAALVGSDDKFNNNS